MKRPDWLWANKSHEEGFLGGAILKYFGKEREHARICVYCWAENSPIAQRNRERGVMGRVECRKMLRKRRCCCPIRDHKNPLRIPWGRNRKHPPDGCLHAFEHSLV